ncbi:MAG: class III signal peptide-containing protein [Anaerolineaceae bacterium]|nr:class III signal peptide-containing protein [Anaerolineaceae bacterium]
MRRVALEKGQGLLEYALIFTFIVLVVLVALYYLGPGIGNLYRQIVTGI